MKSRLHLLAIWSLTAWLVLAGCVPPLHAQFIPPPFFARGGVSKTLSAIGSESAIASCTTCTFTHAGAHFTVVTGFAHVFAFGQAAGLTISSVTICGVSATLSKQSGVANTPGDWYTAAVTASSTCDIVVVYSTGTARNGVSAYNSTGIASVTPSSTGNNAACAAFPTACTTTVATTAVAGGFTLAGGVSQNCTSNSWSVPATRDFFVNIGAGAVCGSTASSSANAGGSHTPSYTDSSGSAGGIAALEY